jgi:hypothetical protein
MDDGCVTNVVSRGELRTYGYGPTAQSKGPENTIPSQKGWFSNQELS